MTRDTQDPRAWLGLSPDADDHEVAATRARLEEFLAEAPPELAGWARTQLDGTPARPAGGSASGVPRGAARRRRSPVVPLGIVAAAAAIGVAVYNIPDSSPAAADPKAAASAPADAMHGTMPATTQPPLDQAKVDALTKKIAADPKDTKAMKELANEYSRTEMFSEAAAIQRKILAVEPKNTDARLALGVAHFNMNDLATAEKEWNAVVKQDPENALAWYDLGFLYLGQEPPQMEKAEAAWKKVVQIDPKSEMAKTVESHLKKFKSGAAAGMGETTSPTNVPSGTSGQG